jgi:hypothetical protein
MLESCTDVTGIQDLKEKLSDGQRETRTIDDRWQIYFDLDEKVSFETLLFHLT